MDFKVIETIIVQLMGKVSKAHFMKSYVVKKARGKSYRADHGKKHVVIDEFQRAWETTLETYWVS